MTLAQGCVRLAKTHSHAAVSSLRDQPLVAPKAQRQYALSVIDDDLTHWVRAWAQLYPAGHDQILKPVSGAGALDRAAALTVIAWKFDAMAHRRTNALRGLARESDQAILDITAAARGCLDDGAAMR